MPCVQKYSAVRTDMQLENRCCCKIVVEGSILDNIGTCVRANSPRTKLNFDSSASYSTGPEARCKFYNPASLSALALLCHREAATRASEGDISSEWKLHCQVVRTRCSSQSSSLSRAVIRFVPNRLPCAFVPGNSYLQHTCAGRMAFLGTHMSGCCFACRGSCP